MKRLCILGAMAFLLAGAWLGFTRFGALKVATGSGAHGSGSLSETTAASQATFTAPTVPSPDSPSPVNPAAAANLPPAAPPAIAVASPARRSLPITPDFVRQLVTGPDLVSFALPDGRTATGIVEIRKRSPDGGELEIGRAHV